MKNETKTKAINAVAIIGLILALGFAAKVGLDKQEKIDCEKWNDWSKTYRLYQMTQDTANYCEAIGVKMDGQISQPTISPAQEKGWQEFEAIKQDWVESKTERTITATVYAYNSTTAQTDARPREMASGKTVYDGAIACPVWLKFGKQIEFNGKVYTCEDRMGERYRSGNYFDIWMPTVESAKQWGVKTLEIKILK